MIVAGWDAEKGGQVFGCPIGGTLVEELQWTTDGSGSTYLWGHLDASFRCRQSARFCETLCRVFCRCSCESAALLTLVYVHDGRPDLSRPEAEDLVAEAVGLAYARDGSSGGLIRLVTIDSEGTHRRLVYPDAVSPLWDEAASVSMQLVSV